MVIYPININFLDWAGGLTAFYPDSDIPIALNEEQWKSWGEILSKSGVFYKAQIPSPSAFGVWQDWAKEVHRCMFDIEIIGENYV